MCIWDIRSGKCVRRIDDYSSELNAVEFYSTGEAVATAATDGTVSNFNARKFIFYHRMLLNMSSLKVNHDFCLP